jgi:hypothetical protein
MADTDQDKEGWARFERAVDAAIKSGPTHKTKATSAPAKTPARKPPKAKR